MDYAMKTGISLSTLRRYIKANKVRYRIESGRYLLLHDDGDGARLATSTASAEFFQNQLEELHADLRKAQEEIAELKMLIALYEERIPPVRHNN